MDDRFASTTNRIEKNIARPARATQINTCSVEWRFIHFYTLNIASAWSSSFKLKKHEPLIRELNSGCAWNIHTKVKFACKWNDATWIKVSFWVFFILLYSSLFLMTFRTLLVAWSIRRIFFFISLYPLMRIMFEHLLGLIIKLRACSTVSTM